MVSGVWISKDRSLFQYSLLLWTLSCPTNFIRYGFVAKSDKLLTLAPIKLFYERRLQVRSSKCCLLFSECKLWKYFIFVLRYFSKITLFLKITYFKMKYCNRHKHKTEPYKVMVWRFNSYKLILFQLNYLCFISSSHR